MKEEPSNTRFALRVLFDVNIKRTVCLFVWLFFSACLAASAQPSQNDLENLADKLLSANQTEREKLFIENERLINYDFFQFLRQRGDRQRETAEFTDALNTFQLAHDIAVKINHKPSVALILGRIGMTHREQGDFDRAISYLDKSIEIAEQSGDKAVLAATFNSVGNVYFMQGDPERALPFYQKALDTFTEMGNQLFVSRALNNIGNVRQMQGNFRLALEAYQKSLEWKEKINEKAGIAWTLNNIGLLHQAQGDYELALNFYGRALPLMEELKNQLGIIEILNNTGNTHRELGDYSKALENHRRSLSIAESVGSRDGVATSLNYIGNAYRDAGDYARAIEFYRRSLTLREEMRQRASMAELLVDLAFTQERTGDGDGAIASAGKALEIARQVETEKALWQSLTLLGRYEMAKRNFEKASANFQEAINIIEQRREQVAGSELNRQSFFSNKLAPYQSMISLLIENGDTAKAFDYAERAKARVLLDVLRRGRADISQKTMSEQERERERTLTNQINALNRDIYAENRKTGPNAARLETLKKQLEKARFDYAAFETNLYSRHTNLKLQRGITEPLSLQETTELLPDAQTALLEFVSVENEIYLFTLTRVERNKPNLKVFRLPVERNKLAKLVSEYHEALAQRRLNFRSIGETLFNILLKPAAAEIQHKNKLIIIPDGELWELPFQALIQPDKKFLIETAEISYAQSLTVLREMRKEKRETKATNNLLVAFGNPSTNSAPQLLTAETQIKTLAQLYGQTRSKTFSGSQAEETTFKTEAGKAQILHLATHGTLNNTNPIYSHLAFSQSSDNKEDGLLEAWEIMKMNLSARLVVLSACETARGRFSAGEGSIGMTWAFFVAGSPTTIVSQWSVEENGTAELTGEFHRRYQRVKFGATPNRTSTAGALREAALKMLAEKKYSHPFYWAGFVIIGDGR